MSIAIAGNHEQRRANSGDAVDCGEPITQQQSNGQKRVVKLADIGHRGERRAQNERRRGMLDASSAATADPERFAEVHRRVSGRHPRGSARGCEPHAHRASVPLRSATPDCHHTRDSRTAARPGPRVPARRPVAARNARLPALPLKTMTVRRGAGVGLMNQPLSVRPSAVGNVTAVKPLETRRLRIGNLSEREVDEPALLRPDDRENRQDARQRVRRSSLIGSGV